jgi:putative oxidoreductase
MNNLQNSADLAGRVFLAAIFLLAGIDKIPGYAATQAYMLSQGVPPGLLPLAIVLEIGAALLLIAGYFTRLAAVALAGFSLLTALLFHLDFGDQMQQIQFMKNIAIAGGLLILAARGAGGWSLDARSRV